MGLAGGKEECWLVLSAGPGATLGIGTLKELSDEELRIAAYDGSIENLIHWIPVQRGDFFYIPSGTIHAVGASITLIEIQQNSDVTFRLYDYDRPRELHVNEAIAVSCTSSYNPTHQRHIDFEQDQMLVNGPLFRVRLTGDSKATLDGHGPLIVLPIEGYVTTIADNTLLTAAAGECLAIDPGSSFEASSGARMLLARSL